MFLNIIDWFKALSPTETVLLIVAAVLIIAIIIAIISSVVTAKKRRELEKSLISGTSIQQPESKEDNQQASPTVSKEATDNKPKESYDALTTDSKQVKSQQETIAEIVAEKPNTQDSEPQAEGKNVANQAAKEPKALEEAQKRDNLQVVKKEAIAKPEKADNAEDAELDSGKDIAEIVEEIQSNERKHGKIVIYKDTAGKFRFQIVAANHEPVGHSRSYGTKAACKSGLKAMLRYSDTEVYDLTLQNNTYKPKIGTASFEIYTDESNRYRFRLRSKNYKLVLASQSYTTKAASNIGIESVKRISENYTLDKN